MVKKNFLKSSLIIAIVVAMMLPVIPTMSFAVTSSNKPSITYSAHMQTYGWDKVNQKPGTALGEAKVFAGVTGQSKRMEALEVNAVGVKLEYRAHVQGKGWMDWVTADGVADHKAIVGTTGASKRVEALQLSVKELDGYSILYRAHVQGEGWMPWVDAEDPTAFAGTTGRSLRMEAFEIVVVPEHEFYYVNNRNGTHTVSYNGKLGATEDCVFGDYEVANEENTTTFTKKCSLCGYSNSETKTLEDVLKDAQLDGQSKVHLGTLNLSEREAQLNIPEGMTLEVADTLTLGTQGVNVDGHLVVKNITDLGTNKDKLTFGTNGKLTFSGVYSEATSNSILNTVLADENDTILKHTDKIVLEKGSGDQTLSGALVVPADTELVLDLNGTKVKTTTVSNYMIESSGDLTINDVNFESTTGKGVQIKNGSLTIDGGKITTAGWGVSLAGSETGAAETRSLKDMPVVIKNVEITITGNNTDTAGVGTYGNYGEVTLESVTIKTDDAKTYALSSNGQTVGAKFNVKNSTIINSKCIAVYIPGQGEYNFENCTITGTEGIECARGKVTLNNTAVTATGNPGDTAFDLRLSAGNGTFTGPVDNGGHNSFGGAVQIKMDKQANTPETTKAVLEMKGNSTLTSHYGPALLVFGTNNTYLKSDYVTPYYTLSALHGYTKNTTKEGACAVVWAHK